MRRLLPLLPLAGCTTTTITQASRIHSFLGWTYKVEPVSGPSAPPGWPPAYPWNADAPPAGFPWGWLLWPLALIALALVVVWRLRGAAAALALASTPLTVARKLIPRKGD